MAQIARRERCTIRIEVARPKHSPRDSPPTIVSFGMNDQSDRDPLASTLRSWSHTPAPAPDFRDQVWSRIRSASSAAPSPFASILRFPSALPLAASLALLLSIAAGTGTAFALNRTVSTDRMAAAYVRTIDPVQLTASGAHSAHAHAHHP